MPSYLLAVSDIDKTKNAIVGGKAANLGELSRMEGIHVPDFFCVSTAAFKRIIATTPRVSELLDQLSTLGAEDRKRIGKLSSEIRMLIDEVPIPEDIIEAITNQLSRLGERKAYAVRSSATAEDLPTASFAGQQDTYLNIIGKQAILRHVSKCWSSLFTERAIAYRIHEGLDHRNVQLAVVVQQMVPARAAGILFTADPVTSNRKLLSIDAGLGLGEALVSGLANPDNYTVRGGQIFHRRITDERQVLTDEQILQLEHIGRKIETHFGNPQDIEWCLADDIFYIVQSRPITTLYPIPEANDQENHVYISVGHQQMMTDPMRPLGLSFFLLTTNAPMRIAGGRLFVDIATHLASPASREKIINVLGQSDPLIKDALMTLVKREEYVKSSPDDTNVHGGSYGNRIMSWIFPPDFENNPAIAVDLIKISETSIEALKQNIQTKLGADLFEFILEDIRQLKKTLANPQSLDVIMVAMHASSWINEKMDTWLGEKRAADTLSLSVSNNVTSEMGLELMNVADVIRPFPEVIDYLQHIKAGNLFDGLVKLDGGKETRDTISAYLDKYGMRCAGEIDITKTRWSEDPGALVPMILSNIKNQGPNAANRKFEQGRQEALKKERGLLDRLKRLPDGAQKAEETQRMISLIRNFIGYREYPKYVMVSRYFIYKQALLKEAEQLVKGGIIHEKEDIFYLTFEELREVVRTQSLDDQVISKRKDEYKWYWKLTPPRVLSSDGEIVAGAYKRENLPAGTMIGLPVSSGVIEGPARVILRMEDADLKEGDILVTAFTDPSWTPLFVSIKGLVTEVGGLMTHGAVIAREYGIPAVVGVENATRLIKDGQRIRVNGTDGYVEILAPEENPAPAK
jgi:phosphoenolpyruvate synthase/pyruvate phosphate dikinase